MNADHSLHVMFYYDHLAGAIEDAHPCAHHDWPETAQVEYDRVFNRSVEYGYWAQSNVIRTSASGSGNK